MTAQTTSRTIYRLDGELTLPGISRKYSFSKGVLLSGAPLTDGTRILANRAFRLRWERVFPVASNGAREIEINISEPGDDYGKTFHIRRMSAWDADRWGRRVIYALLQSQVRLRISILSRVLRAWSGGVSNFWHIYRLKRRTPFLTR